MDPRGFLLLRRMLARGLAAVGQNGTRSRLNWYELWDLPLNEEDTGLLLTELYLNGTNVVRPRGGTNQTSRAREEPE